MFPQMRNTFSDEVSLSSSAESNDNQTEKSGTTDRAQVSKVYDVLGNIEPAAVYTEHGEIPQEEYYNESKESETCAALMEKLGNKTSPEELRSYRHFRGCSFFAFMDKEKAISFIPPCGRCNVWRNVPWYWLDYFAEWSTKYKSQLQMYEVPEESMYKNYSVN